MKIASFNVNSINARLPRLLEWLKSSNPDVVLLQELKCIDENFPKDAIFDAGYNVLTHGQKTYNGVAILSKFRMEEICKNLPTFDDEQARYIEALVFANDKTFRIASVYVPNGGAELAPGQKVEDSAKFQYKMHFYDCLKEHLQNLRNEDEDIILGGDFNVSAEEIDLYDPKNFDGHLLFTTSERTKFRSLLNLGLTDSYRAKHPNNHNFSWWDYRGNSWINNKGFRIDYILTSPKMTDLIESAGIEDKGVRDQEKASDHCPVTVTLKL